MHAITTTTRPGTKRVEIRIAIKEYSLSGMEKRTFALRNGVEGRFSIKASASK